MQFGVVLQGIDPPSEFVSLVRLIEDLEYDSLWLTDSSLHARYVYSYLTLAATVSHRLKLGTSVTNPLTRHPALGALAISTVDEISGGRAIYGIGAGDRPIEALGYRPAKLTLLREAVEVTRCLLRGETVTLKGQSLRLNQARIRVSTRADLPIYMSATGPKTLELAGEIADGVILLGGLFKEGIEYAMSHIQAGQARNGGRPLEIAVFGYGSIKDDYSQAIEDARSIAAWFCQTAPIYCELAGMPAALIEEVRAAYAGGEFQEAQEAASLIPDEMVTRMALAGTPEDGRRKVDALIGLGIHNINIFPLGRDRRQTIINFAREVIQARTKDRRSGEVDRAGGSRESMVPSNDT
jgi:5,10-methylenetetrahydromethanopterin reductase